MKSASPLGARRRRTRRKVSFELETEVSGEFLGSGRFGETSFDVPSHIHFPLTRLIRTERSSELPDFRNGLPKDSSLLSVRFRLFHLICFMHRKLDLPEGVPAGIFADALGSWLRARHVSVRRPRHECFLS